MRDLMKKKRVGASPCCQRSNNDAPMILAPMMPEEDNDAPCSGSPWPHVREVMPGASKGKGLDGPQ